MSEDDLKREIKQLMAAIFEVPEDSVSEDSSPDTIENWDSVSQLNLVAAVESQFGIELTADDAVDMISFSLIFEILKEKFTL